MKSQILRKIYLKNKPMLNNLSKKQRRSYKSYRKKSLIRRSKQFMPILLMIQTQRQLMMSLPIILKVMITIELLLTIL